MTLIERITKAMKVALSKDDGVYFRDDGDTCMIDGHVDMKALAEVAIDAAHQELSRGEFRGRPCYIIQDVGASVGLCDENGDMWVMEIDKNGQPRCQRIESRYLYTDVSARKQ